jgi:glycosyltransferase involved in cell wall biosynthesis
VRFVLAGSGVERGAPEFERAFARAGSPGNVIALGARRDVPYLAAGLDVVASASSTLEGFPNALGEALASGTPCLATDVGDSARLVGEAGAVVPPGDARAWREALTALVRAGDAERRALGARGRERVRERYELGRVVAQYEELWSELAGAVPCAV